MLGPTTLIIEYCPICGKEYRRYPSDSKKTCSATECKSKYLSRLRTGKPVKWGNTARERLSKFGQTNNLKMGTQAAKKSPLAGPFETNVTAKYWKIQSPSGEIFEFNNLLKWCRENADLFDKEVGNPKDARAIASAFRAIKQTQQGKPRRVHTYKQWTLLDFKEYNTLHVNKVPIMIESSEM